MLLSHPDILSLSKEKGKWKCEDAQPASAEAGWGRGSGDAYGISGVDEVGVGDSVQGHQGGDGGPEADCDPAQGVAGLDGIVPRGGGAFFRDAYGLAGVDQIRVGNVVQCGQRLVGGAVSYRDLTQGIPGLDDIGDIVRRGRCGFRRGSRLWRRRGLAAQMVQAGFSDDGSIIHITGVQVYISCDSGDASGACVLPDAVVDPVVTAAVTGKPQCIAPVQIPGKIGLQEILIAVIHGKISPLLDPVAEGFYNLGCQRGRDRHAVLFRIGYGSVFNIVADRIFHPVWSDHLQASIRLLPGILRAEGIAEPVRACRESDAVAFGRISAELLVRRPEALCGAWHGGVMFGAGDLRPIYNSLKFTDIKSLYTHEKLLSQDDVLSLYYMKENPGSAATGKMQTKQTG